jgi:hypothetical protein
LTPILLPDPRISEREVLVMQKKGTNIARPILAFPLFSAVLRSTTVGFNRLSDRKAAQMDEDKFNISVRKYLKVVGITAQREIEKGVREALNTGRLRGDENLKAKVTLEIEALGLTHLIEGDIELG